LNWYIIATPRLEGRLGKIQSEKIVPRCGNPANLNHPTRTCMLLTHWSVNNYYGGVRLVKSCRRLYSTLVQGIKLKERGKRKRSEGRNDAGLGDLGGCD